MKTSYIIGLWILFIGGSLISGIVEMQYLSGSGNTSVNAVFANLFAVPTMKSVNALNVVVVSFEIVWNWIVAFFNMLTWNYAFFTGGYVIIKWILLYPLSIGLVASTIMVLRGTSSS